MLEGLDGFGDGWFFCHDYFPALLADGLDHFVKFAFDLGREIGFDLINLGELGKRPAAILSGVVHAGNPIGVHRGFFLLGVFAPVAFDFDNQVQQVGEPRQRRWPSSTRTMKSGR